MEFNPKQDNRSWRFQQSLCRRRGEPGGPIVLTDGLAAFGDRPGLAARRTADIHNRPSKRVGLRGHRVAAWARKKPSGLAGIHWPFIHVTFYDAISSAGAQFLLLTSGGSHISIRVITNW